MSSPVTILWIRQCLRLKDNPALEKALSLGQPVIPLWVADVEERGPWAPGGASRWWLHHSLAAFQTSLHSHHSQLILRQGKAVDVLSALAQEVTIAHIVTDERFDPWARDQQEAVQAYTAAQGIAFSFINTNLMRHPSHIATQTGSPYKVFTPFWKSWQVGGPPPKPSGTVPAFNNPHQWPTSLALEELGLLPTIPWDSGLQATWAPGEAGAWERLETFLADPIATYATDRDRPDHPGTSMISPHLHFGEISPSRIWHRCYDAYNDGRQTAEAQKSANTYIRELGWREFAHHVLYHFPHTPTSPLQERFAAFPWTLDTAAQRAWEKGLTGYPIVDAGMRELWHTGWMHNRVRMIVASFLVKDLLLSWEVGARWFWDTLVDADLANNTLGWQWAGGCGADAAPYFRVFNPMMQGAKFDPEGTYVRRWVPKLAKLPTRWIHQPWEAPPLVLQDAGITLGDTYPHPMVDHFAARDAALAAFQSIANSVFNEA